MRPSALLTGLTGVVAVMVLAYSGLAAMNLRPHIIFGDPGKAVAVAGRVEEARPAMPVVVASEKPTPVVTPEAPAKPESPAAPPPISLPAIDTPKAPVATAAVTPPAAEPAPAGPAHNEMTSAVAPRAQENAGSAVAPSDPSAGPAPGQGVKLLPSTEAKPPAASTPLVAEAAPAIPAPSAAPSTPATDKVEKPADTDDAKSLPPLATIPTPEKRPEPDKAPIVPEPEPAKDPVAASATPEPVEQASPPPETPSTATKPLEPAAGAAAPNAVADLKPLDLSRPLAERAGVLTIGNRRVQLADIQPTDPAKSCTGPNGKEWPCGTLARTALRTFLLGRTVTCDVADPQWTGSVTAVCRFARVDLSDWLARNGWAEPTPGSSLVPIAEQARKDGLGIYGNDPRQKHISTLAPEPPKENPLNPI